MHYLLSQLAIGSFNYLAGIGIYTPRLFASLRQYIHIGTKQCSTHHLTDIHLLPRFSHQGITS